MSKLSRKIARRTQINESDVRSVLNCMTDCIKEDLKQSGMSSIPALGKVKLTAPVSRRMHDVVTGAVRSSMPKRRLSFSFYESFRGKVSDEEVDLS